jgi:hypothetical protein
LRASSMNVLILGLVTLLTGERVYIGHLLACVLKLGVK